MKINNEILKIDNEGLQLNFKQGLLTEWEGLCVIGAIREDSLCLGFVEMDNKKLTIKDEDTEFYNVEKEDFQKENLKEDFQNE